MYDIMIHPHQFVTKILNATWAFYHDTSPAEDQASSTPLKSPTLLSLYKYTYCVIWYLAPATAHWPTGLGRYRAGLGAKPLGWSQTGKDVTVRDREKADTVGTGRGPAKVGARRPASPSKKNKPPTSSFRDLKPAFLSSPHFQPHRLPCSIFFADLFIKFVFAPSTEKYKRKERHFAHCLVDERARRLWRGDHSRAQTRHRHHSTRARRRAQSSRQSRQLRALRQLARHVSTERHGSCLTS